MILEFKHKNFKDENKIKEVVNKIFNVRKKQHVYTSGL